MATEKELEEQRLAAELQTLQDYQDTFGSPHGKRCLENLKNRCHYDEIINCDDPIILAIVTGERNAVLHIIQALRIDPSKTRQIKAEDNQQPTDEIEGPE